MIGMKQKTLEMNKLKNTKWLRQKFFEKYDNLSENELNKRIECQKWYYEFCHKTCRGKKKKKRAKRSIDRFTKKVTTECVISECSEYDVKSKIGNIFVNEKFTKNIV